MLVRLLMSLAVFAQATAVAIATEGLSVPSQADQNAALKLVKDVFKTDYAKAKSPSDKLALAQKLLKQGADTQDDPIGRFVLLREARDLGTEVGSFDVVLNAVEAIAEQYEIDSQKMLLESLTKAKRVTKPLGISKQDLSRVMVLIEEAVDSDDFEFATAMAPIAVAIAKGLGADTLKSVNTRITENETIQKAQGSVRLAREKLKNDPDDGDACLTDGRYRCFLRGDWDAGLPLLSKCSNSTLKALAASDIAAPTDAAAQASVGDGWRTLAEKEAGLARGHLALRSKYWYEKSEKSLTGLTAAKVKKRLDETDSLLKETSLAGASASMVATAGSSSDKKSPPLAISPFDFIHAKRHQQAWSTHLKQPSTLKNSIGMQFKLIPPGEFIMGSPESEAFRDKHEAQHKVKIANAYFMGMFEVTQEQYATVTGQRPSGFKGETNPVEQVSWVDAKDFCSKLSNLPKEKEAGRVYQLPTAEEWEYACRAGTTTAYYFGDDKARLVEFGWLAPNSDGKSHPVGQKPPNAWGLFDIHGNVFEWCDSTISNMKIARGGSWFPDRDGCARAAFVNADNEHRRLNYWGFRIICNMPNTKPQ